jgi:hypothetical protein
VINKSIVEVWEFKSDSNPSKRYQTLRYSDGSTSCNCPGWTRCIDGAGRRSCKHTRDVDMGMATENAAAHTDYRTKVDVTVRVTAPGMPVVTRRFAFDTEEDSK